MSINPNLLEILACPECKGELVHDRKNRLLICNLCKVAYPINDRDIPLLLHDESVPHPDRNKSV